MLVVQRELVWIRNALQYTLWVTIKVRKFGHNVKHKRASPPALSAALQCVSFQEWAEQINSLQDGFDELRERARRVYQVAP